MKSRALRAVLVLLAIAAMAGAGSRVWLIEQQVAGARSAAADFDRTARLAVLGFTEIRGAQQAYVAEGQNADNWLNRVETLVQATAPRLTELRLAARSAEAQGSLEASIEAFSAFGQADSKARDYMKSAQRLSASDVIFADGASSLAKVINAVDTARAQESVAREIAIAPMRQQQLYVLGGAGVIALLIVLLLAPLPRGVAGRADAGASDPVADLAAAGGGASGLGLSQMPVDRPARTARATGAGLGAGAGAGLGAGLGGRAEDDPFAIGSELDRLIGESSGPDLAAVADICSAFAKVEEPRELHGLLERTAKALDATGVIVWMQETPQAALRPVLAFGYPPLSLTRMGTIDPAADNATAVAFRTRQVQTVSTEPLASGAIVAPLVTSDGCSGTMSVELKEGVRTTPQLQAVATILAAQLATLITPSTPPPAQGAGHTPAQGQGQGNTPAPAAAQPPAHDHPPSRA